MTAPSAPEISLSDLRAQIAARLRGDAGMSPRAAIWTIAGLTTFQAALPVFSALMLGIIVDRLASGGTASLLPLVVLWGVTLLAMVPAGALAAHGIEVFSQRVQVHVSELVAAKAAELDLVSIERPDIQELLFRAQQDATQRLPSLLTAILTGVSGLVITMALLVGLAIVAPMVAVLLLLPLLLAVPAAAGWHRVQDWQRQRVRMVRTAKYLHRLLSEPRAGAEVRAFHLAATLLARTASLWRDVLGLQVKIARWTCRAEIVVSSGLVLGVVAGTAYAVTQALDSTLTVGTVVMLIHLQQRTYATAQRLQRTLAEMAAYGTDFGVLRQFLALAAPEKPVPVVPGPRPLTTGLRFDGVSFRYPDAVAPAVDDVSLTIMPGTTLAIVGPNGSGKTTLLKLLCRLYTPTAGRILWDGVEIQHFDIAAWRATIAVAFQDAVRYELSVLDNIAFGSPDVVSSEAIRRAAEAAGASELIARLPKGFDTPLGSMRTGGVQLSGGQWQALALARALLRTPPLLLLDEPNHNLDPDAEARLFERLRADLAGRTSVIISHRFLAARLADAVVVMDQGRIVEHGTHEALLARQGIYAHLFMKQAQGYR
jgi:ATP-binding cassette subfamily B protein